MKNSLAKPAIACVGFELPTHQLLFDFLSIQFDITSVENPINLNEVCKHKNVFAVLINLHEYSSSNEEELLDAIVQAHRLSIFIIHPISHRKIYREIIQVEMFYKVIVCEEKYSWSSLHDLSEELIRLHQYKKQWTNLLK